MITHWEMAMDYLRETFLRFDAVKARADRLEREKKKLVAMLRALQWIDELENPGKWSPTTFMCPYCERRQHQGHAPDCDLAALLEEVDDE
jgi:hypothetical protein